MAASQTLGVLSGNAPAEAAAAHDPNAPVEKPRHCGLCKHFSRFEVTEALNEPRRRRFGNCGRAPGFAGEAFDETKAPTTLGPDIVGDEFACKFFDSGF